MTTNLTKATNLIAEHITPLVEITNYSPYNYDDPTTPHTEATPIAEALHKAGLLTPDAAETEYGICYGETRHPMRTIAWYETKQQRNNAAKNFTKQGYEVEKLTRLTHPPKKQ